jgi:hypothetical protein
MLDSYTKWLADKNLPLLRFYIWFLAAIAAYAVAKYITFGGIITAFITFNIIADMLDYKASRLKEAQDKNPHLTLKKMGYTAEQWEHCSKKINTLKLAAFVITMLCNILVILAFRVKFDYYLIIYAALIVSLIAQELHAPTYLAYRPLQFTNQSLHTPNYQVSNVLQDHPTSLHSNLFSDSSYSHSSIPTFESYSSTSNSGVPGFNVNGTYTGSDTAIGGISN